MKIGDTVLCLSFFFINKVVREEEKNNLPDENKKNIIYCAKKL